MNKRKLLTNVGLALTLVGCVVVDANPRRAINITGDEVTEIQQPNDPVSVTVLGSVRSPGRYDVDGGVLTAIYLAGGVEDEACPERVKIEGKFNNKEELTLMKLPDLVEVIKNG